MAPPNQDVLAAVERSPQAAAAHDRAGWVRLFTGDARVEDPVGSAAAGGHRGHRPLLRHPLHRAAGYRSIAILGRLRHGGAAISNSGRDESTVTVFIPRLPTL